MQKEISLEEAQARILAGESLTIEEYRSIIERYRASRKAAAAKRSKPTEFDLAADIDEVFRRLEGGE